MLATKFKGKSEMTTINIMETDLYIPRTIFKRKLNLKSQYRFKTSVILHFVKELTVFTYFQD